MAASGPLRSAPRQTSISGSFLTRHRIAALCLVEGILHITNAPLGRGRLYVVTAIAISMPPRGFERTSCTGQDQSGEDNRAAWLVLAARTTPCSWQDRATEMKALHRAGRDPGRDWSALWTERRTRATDTAVNNPACAPQHGARRFCLIRCLGLGRIHTPRPHRPGP